MALDTLSSRERNVALLERYGNLLNDHQRAVLDLYLRSDWSLAEIALRHSVSRAAVHDLVRRAVAGMEEDERRLGLLAEAERRRETRDAIAAELADLRRRMSRLEERVLRV